MALDAGTVYAASESTIQISSAAPGNPWNYPLQFPPRASAHQFQLSSSSPSSKEDTARHWQPSRHARPRPRHPSYRAGVVVASHPAPTRPPHGPSRFSWSSSQSVMVLYYYDGLGCGGVVRDDLVDTGDVEGGIVVDKIHGVVAVVGIGTGPGAGAGAVGVGSGLEGRIERIGDALRERRRSFLAFREPVERGVKEEGGESKSQEGAESPRIVPGRRTYGWTF